MGDEPQVFKPVPVSPPIDCGIMLCGSRYLTRKPTSQSIRLNFVPLSAHAIVSRLWRKLLPPNTPKPEDAMCYTLPVALDAAERAMYLIRLTPENGYEPWEFNDLQNRQLALRYLFELLACRTIECHPAHCFNIYRGFQRGIAYTVNNTALGQQQIWLEPYYLSVNKQYGFLMDFHFRKSVDGHESGTPAPKQRKVETLLRSLPMYQSKSYQLRYHEGQTILRAGH